MRGHETLNLRSNAVSTYLATIFPYCIDAYLQAPIILFPWVQARFLCTQIKIDIVRYVYT